MASPSPAPFEPATLGPLVLRNRFIKAATFEGATPNGEITAALVEFHTAVAAGGVGMSTLAYLAVAPEGRTDRHCLVAGEEIVPGLRRLADAIHSHGAAAAVQIGHAGPVANARSNRSAALAPSRMVSPLGSVIRAAADADIERIIEDYARAARLVREAGFDSVEIHMGHNYLLSAFLSPKLNRRQDRWGGSVENRARFPRTVARRVREAVGPSMAVTAKLNMDDGVPGGLWLDQSLQAASMLESDGYLDALELTGGSSLANPMYLFRGEAPRAEFGATLPRALRVGFRIAGKRFLREYPFSEAYFLPYAREFLAALDIPLVLLGGVTRLDTVESALAEGFAFVAMARALLREPALGARWQAGRASESLCIHCNKCMPTIYSGTRCVLAS